MAVAKKRAARAKALRPRLLPIPEDKMTEPQRRLLAAIQSGPRGKVSQGGPFGVFLRAPAYGDLVQQLGAHCRYKTAVPPRLSEFAILCTARFWRAQYEWYAHARIAAQAGVTAATIAAIKAGRRPARMSKEESAIYDFIAEIYKSRRVSDRTYARVCAFLGEAGTVELVGILGYYALVSMTLNAFNIPLPEGATPGFKEPAARR